MAEIEISTSPDLGLYVSNFNDQTRFQKDLDEFSTLAFEFFKNDVIWAIFKPPRNRKFSDLRQNHVIFEIFNVQIQAIKLQNQILRVCLNDFWRKITPYNTHLKINNSNLFKSHFQQAQPWLCYQNSLSRRCQKRASHNCFFDFSIHVCNKT